MTILVRAAHARKQSVLVVLDRQHGRMTTFWIVSGALRICFDLRLENCCGRALFLTHRRLLAMIFAHVSFDHAVTLSFIAQTARSTHRSCSPPEGPKPQRLALRHVAPDETIPSSPPPVEVGAGFIQRLRSLHLGRPRRRDRPRGWRRASAAFTGRVGAECDPVSTVLPGRASAPTGVLKHGERLVAVLVQDSTRDASAEVTTTDAAGAALALPIPGLFNCDFRARNTRLCPALVGLGASTAASAASALARKIALLQLGEHLSLLHLVG